MNQWAFVAAAYGTVLLGVAAVSLASWRAMRRAERATRDGAADGRA